MMNMDGPLDFESEEPLLKTQLNPKRSRKKVIDLDDLLTDYYKEKGKVVERESKRSKSRKNYDSDEDDCSREAFLSSKINECHKQIKKMGGEEEISTWGVQVFGNQKTPLPLISLELGSCSLLQSFMNNELNSLVEVTNNKGDTFLEGLLVNGWILKLISKIGYVEKSIAEWTFNLMLYSSKEELMVSACEFWCTILSNENKAEKLPITIEWFPSYSELKTALETYGFLFNFSSQAESLSPDSGCRGPPKNIRAWFKFMSACCFVRGKQPILSSSEAEELVEVLICVSLDRRLQALLILLDECMQSVFSCFTAEEWKASCEKIARSLACRVPKDFNCLRTVECISGDGIRSNHLRSAVSYQILLHCFDYKATSEEDMLSLLISLNLKDKQCDLFKMYIYLNLTENWLFYSPVLRDKAVIHEMWGVYLRNCSCQITSTDLRPYASKVRSRASYFLHGTTKR